VTTQAAFTLINPQTKALAFNIFYFADDSYFKKQTVYNYYSILLVTAGSGKLKADFSEYKFTENALLCFSVYQPFVISPDDEFKGVLINFHSDFFCIHKHQEEVACNGVLFNNIYDPPLFQLKPNEMQELLSLVLKIKAEMQNPAPAQYEILVAYLKIFLINASRLKMIQQPSAMLNPADEPFILKNLKDAIEEHYRTKHGPGDYAELLNISTKALNRISKTHLNRTLSNLITERLIIEAKRELYLTTKPVKSIAYELGFSDEFYFSRFFKNNTEVSPQIYRSTVGFGKGG
jgi:AraC-like DNA-binding protein